jgi:hypothetical protein
MSWSVGGLSITPSDLSVDHQTLTLRGIIKKDIDQWRKYDRSGDIETIVGAGGEYRTISRGTRSTVTVTPPADLRPTPFDTHEAYVANYQEFQQSPGVHEVVVDLRRDTNRPRVYANGDYTLSSPAFDLELSMARVDLPADAVRRTDLRGDPAGGRWTLPLLLKDQPARIVLESLSHNDATTERTVPDGRDFPTDTTADDKNLVRVSAPSRATLPEGTFVVSGFSVDRHTHRRGWAADLELRFKGDLSGAFDYSFDLGFG